MNGNLGYALVSGMFKLYGNFGLIAFVVHADTHFRQYTHSGSVNFSQGNSKMRTFIGHTSTHARHPTFVHFTGSLSKPRKLNLFRKARAAPWGQRYRHQLLGMYMPKITTPIIMVSWTQKSMGFDRIPLTIIPSMFSPVLSQYGIV